MPRKIHIAFLLVQIFGLSGLIAGYRDTSDYGEIRQTETHLCTLGPNMISGSTDSARFASSWQLFYSMDTLLRNPHTFYYPFDSLVNNVVSIVRSEDDKFRLYTFNSISLGGDYRNFGFLQVKTGDDVRLYPLTDTTVRRDKDPIKEELLCENWFGALYYDIIPLKYKGHKTYLLFGYDGMDIHSNKKILDILWFDQDEPIFGKPVFIDGLYDNEPKCRVVFEFHNESRMVMRFENKQGIVVTDHLAPAFPEAVNDYYYYIPSGDYDCYYFKKGLWVRDALKNMNFGQRKKPKKPKILPSPDKDTLNPDYKG